MISQLSAKYQIGAIHTADTMWWFVTESIRESSSFIPAQLSIVQTQFGDTLNRCSRRFQVVSWPNLTLSHTQTGYTLKPCTRRFQVVSWPNLTLSHTQTGYTLKPWHRYYRSRFTYLAPTSETKASSYDIPPWLSLKKSGMTPEWIKEHYFERHSDDSWLSMNLPKIAEPHTKKPTVTLRKCVVSTL